MIPKIIHYCWFGRKPLPADVEKYIKSWKHYCPDYEIIRWDESNFDVTENEYCREAYDNKKYAFVADYVRLKVVYDYGGIYMDTDVEVVKNMDELLPYNVVLGYESDIGLTIGTYGACRNNSLIKIFLDYYNGRKFVMPDGSFDLTTNVVIITNIIKNKYNYILDGKRNIIDDGVLILPFDYLCAKRLMDGKIVQTDNTYTIHHFSGSWIPRKDKFKKYIRVFVANIFGEQVVLKLRRIARIIFGGKK